MQTSVESYLHPHMFSFLILNEIGCMPKMRKCHSHPLDSLRCFFLYTSCLYAGCLKKGLLQKYKRCSTVVRVVSGEGILESSTLQCSGCDVYYVRSCMWWKTTRREIWLLRGCLHLSLHLLLSTITYHTYHCHD